MFAKKRTAARSYQSATRHGHRPEFRQSRPEEAKRDTEHRKKEKQDWKIQQEEDWSKLTLEFEEERRLLEHFSVSLLR